jgi:hypothetical protein
MLTPSDVVTVTLMLMVPLIVLYEISIALSAIVSRKREEAAEEGRSGPGSTGLDSSGPLVLAFLIPVARWRARAVGGPRRSHA